MEKTPRSPSIGGLGAFAGKIWRIGIMGESCTKNHVNALVGALEELI